jgi:Ser-tRNA(Ala) deacylase AlaX
MKRANMLHKLKATKGYHFFDGPYVEYVGDMTDQETKDLPDILNKYLVDIISENISSLTIAEISSSEAKDKLDCDTEGYPDKIRVVKVADMYCPCGGTHIKSTGELIAIKVTKIKKKKNVIKVNYEL